MRKLKSFVRATNIAICGIAIVCLLLMFFVAGFYIALGLTLALQLFLFAAFMSFELGRPGSLARHIAVFVLIIVTIGAGYFFTARLMSAMVPGHRVKKSELTYPQTKTGGLSAARFKFVQRSDQITICRNGG